MYIIDDIYSQSEVTSLFYEPLTALLCALMALLPTDRLHVAKRATVDWFYNLTRAGLKVLGLHLQNMTSDRWNLKVCFTHRGNMAMTCHLLWSCVFSFGAPCCHGVDIPKLKLQIDYLTTGRPKTTLRYRMTRKVRQVIPILGPVVLSIGTCIWYCMKTSLESNIAYTSSFLKNTY